VKKREHAKRVCKEDNNQNLWKGKGKESAATHIKKEEKIKGEKPARRKEVYGGKATLTHNKKEQEAMC